MIQTGATPPIPVVDADGWRLATPPAGTDLTHLVEQAGHSLRDLPAAVSVAIDRFRRAPGRIGALALRGVPVGHIPPTPTTPTAAAPHDPTSELALLTVARMLGHPVGYRPEHGGDIVQNIVPTRCGAAQQISTSSKVDLLLHTETAFHPHRPRHLLLLCLRGDEQAGTTIASAADLLDHLDPTVVETLCAPRFRTAVDASFLDGRPSPPGTRHAVLSGPSNEPTLIFDADLTTGVDAEAERSLRALEQATARHHGTVVLEPGDLLIVDNHRAVHGRTAFRPRFDGTDRWLQRAFVVPDLAPSANDREGLVITTEFTAPDGARSPEPVLVD